MSFQSTYTAKDVADSIKRTFGDEAGVQVNDTDILRWINAAQIEIVSNNKILKAVGTTQSVANQDVYSVDASMKIMVINSIHYNGVKLAHKSFHDAEEYIAAEDPSKTQRATPEFWYEWAGEIYLYPTPGKSNDTIKIYFLPTPTKITSIDQVLSVPDNYFNRVVEFVMSHAYEMDENFAAHQTKFGQFQEGILNMSLNEDTVQVDTYSTITIRPEDA